MRHIEEKYAQLLIDSLKAKKLTLPAHLADLPVDCPNLNLLTDETIAALDERTELIAVFTSGIGDQINATSCWGNSDYTDFTINPFPGAIGVSYDGGWGRSGKVKFRKKLENVTLLDIWKACDTLIRQSGDDHHVFIEELKLEDMYVTFWCGS